MNGTPAADEAARLRAKIRAEDFQRALAARLRRHHPDDFVPFAADRLDFVLRRPDLLSSHPPHFLIHAIAANCAYHHGVYREPVTPELFRRTINEYHRFRDPVPDFLLASHRRVDHFLINMARQQFYLQEVVHVSDLARAILLFRDGAYPKTSGALLRQLGFGFAEWLRFSFITTASLLAKHDGAVAPAYFTSIPPSVLRQDLVDPLLRLVSLDAEAVRERYLKLRSSLQGLIFHLYVPSVFEKRPLFRLSDGRYVAVHKGLMRRRVSEGLFDLGRTHCKADFGEEFGAEFEGYVGNVLGDLPAVAVVSERQLRTVTPEKVCDHVVVGNDFVLLVECKATEYGATFASDGALRGDNSTAKLGEAVDQIASTARLIRDGVLESLLGDATGKALVAGIATFRHIQFANEDAYWTDNILPRTDATPHDLEALLSHRPQIFDIRTLEKLVVTSRGESASIPSLYAEKLAEPFSRVGEWATFLDQRIQKEWRLPLHEDVFTGFTQPILEAFRVAEQERAAMQGRPPAR